MQLNTMQICFDESNWYNELTNEMNKHLLSGWKENFDKGYTYGTYLNRADREIPTIGIRFPGATRGHILLDENKIIKDIVLYDTACESSVACYDKTVIEAIKKFIGYKLVILKKE